MIRGYCKIAFVYGQSTYGIADEVKKSIEKKYADYPIEIKLCDDSSFREAKGDTNISSVVKHEFDGVEFAIIFIGKDMLTYSFPSDNFQPPKNERSLQEIVTEELFGHKTQIEPNDFSEWISKKLKFTLSQNAVFEMGHLWTKFKKNSFDNIRFVPVFSKEDEKLFQYPSDIPIKDNFRFYYNNGDTDFYLFIDKLIKKVLNISPNADVLNSNKYQVDYNDLFTNDELNIIESRENNIDEQFSSINELWSTQVMSLKKDYERLIFIYERLVFLSYFPYDKGFDSWLTTAMGTIQDNDTLFYKILIQIKEYISERQQQGREKGNKFEIYKNIAEKLCDIKNELEKQKVKINPLIEIYLNDYIGLACRVTVQEFEQLDDKPHFDRTEYLNRSIVALKRCNDIETHLSNEASCLWSGYSIYNLARTYDVMGESNNSINYMAKAYRIREKWLKMSSVGNMPRVFEHSFKAEYILTALDSMKKNCFEESEQKRIESLCEGVLESLKFVKIESVAIVETAKKRFEDRK